MREYQIPVTWQVYGKISVTAESLGEAVEIAREDDSIPLPDGDYIEDSWEVDEELARSMNE